MSKEIGRNDKRKERSKGISRNGRERKKIMG
jgi:hypothetical protein